MHMIYDVLLVNSTQYLPVAHPRGGLGGHGYSRARGYGLGAAMSLPPCHIKIKKAPPKIKILGAPLVFTVIAHDNSMSTLNLTDPSGMCHTSCMDELVTCRGLMRTDNGKLDLTTKRQGKRMF